MASRALVVGCDGYRDVEGSDLRGAVSDALAMRQWLLDPTGGGLREADVLLLASTSDNGAAPPEGAVTGEATVRDFLRALTDLATSPSTQNDRLFVYFAGHGCQTDPTNQALSEDAIVFSDFNEYQPQAGCMGVTALERRLRAMRYGEFFIFIDACRNFPYDRPFQLGGLGFDPAQEKQRAYTPRSHVFQATAPGGVAEGEPTVDGGISGLFTRWLLDGLRGEGEAKTFNPTTPTPRYEVTWDRLRAWVEGRLPDQQPLARAEGNPVLAQFDDGYFSDIELQVYVGPAGLSARDDLMVLIEYDNLVDPHLGRIIVTGPTPSRHWVPPRRQRVFARAPGLQWGRQSVDAYADTVIDVVVPTALAPEQTVIGDRRVVRNADRKAEPVSIKLWTQDPATVVELVDLGGRRVAAHTGALDTLAEPGSYVARVHLPGSAPQEHAVEVFSEIPESRALPVSPMAKWQPVSMADRQALDHLTDIADGSTLSVQCAPGVSPSRVPDRWTFQAEPDGEPILVGDWRVQVPLHFMIHTSVAIPASAPLIVRLIDRPLIGTRAALLLERAQAFEEAGQSEHCRILLDTLAELEVTSDVACALRGGPELTPNQQAIASSLVRNWGGEDLLPGQVWRVTASLRYR